MKANHIPRVERLRRRVGRLQDRLESSRGPSDTPGNPYWRCLHCGIYDPQRSANEGRHHRGCLVEGLDLQIAYYKRLLADELDPPTADARFREGQARARAEERHLSRYDRG